MPTDIAGVDPKDGGVAAALTCNLFPRCDAEGSVAGRAFLVTSA